MHTRTCRILIAAAFLIPTQESAAQRNRAIEPARPAPVDSTAFAEGDYELFVQATTPSGVRSHPSYGDERHHVAAEQLSGASYPIQIRIDN